MDPCVYRPANGWACAENFGRDYAVKHGRAPKEREIANSLGRNWNPHYLRQLIRRAIEAAEDVLVWGSKDSLIKRSLLEKEVQNASSYLNRQGVLLSVERSTSRRGHWVLAANFSGAVVRAENLSELLGSLEAQIVNSTPTLLKLVS